jgi:tripartite ATP-independent transporter DctM subunit
MDWTTSLFILLAALMVLLFLGIPVAFSFWLLNLGGFFFFMGGLAGMPALITSLRSSMASFTLTAVPFFILMGDVLFRSGIATRMFDVMEMWLVRLPGRLSLVTVAAATLLGALSGSSLGVTGMLGTMLTPDMRGRGYHPSMITGPIMAGGSLAVIIPPSILVIILAGLAEVSAGNLLIAGVIPGLFMGIAFACYIIFRCVGNPSLAPSAPDVSDIPLSQKLRVTGVSLVPAAFIVFLVLGTIFLGVATPTEAAAGGGFGAFILTAVYRKLSLKFIKECIMSCVRITGLTLIIGTGSIGFSQLLGFTGVTGGIMEVALGLPLPPIFIVCATLGILLILGCFIDQISMLMIGVPIFMPVIVALGYEPLWYGTLFILAITVGYITPPFGMLFFVVKGVVPDISMGTIYRSAYPYVVLAIMVIILIILSPKLVTWLPGLM